MLRRLKWIVIVFLLLLIIGGGVAAFFFRDQAITLAMQLMGKEPPPGGTGAKQVATAPPPPDPNAPPALGTYYSLPNIFATARASNNVPHVVHMQVGIFMHDPTDIIWIQAYLPRIMDAFQSYIHDEIVLDQNHPIRVETLRTEMMNRINAVIAPARITNIVVQSMVVG